MHRLVRDSYRGLRKPFSYSFYLAQLNQDAKPARQLDSGVGDKRKDDPDTMLLGSMQCFPGLGAVKAEALLLSMKCMLHVEGCSTYFVVKFTFLCISPPSRGEC